MNIKVSIQLKKLCQEIVDFDYSEEDWVEEGLSESFQNKLYAGQFDADENEFCFTYFSPDNNEYAFQLSLSTVNLIARGKKPSITGTAI